MANTKNRFLVTFATAIIALVAALFIIPSVSASAEWDGSIAAGFADGDGTGSNPYLIYNGAQLAYLAQQINSGVTYEGEYFILINNIDLGGIEWTPIGYSGYDDYDNPVKEIKFGGIFDGVNFTISGIRVNDIKHAGLFGYNSGEIYQLYLADIQISSQNGIGGICAYNHGTIEAIDIKDGTLRISGASGGNIGGICESNYGTISKCVSRAELINAGSNAGIAVTNYGNIENCYYYGNIEATSGNTTAR